MCMYKRSSLILFHLKNSQPELANISNDEHCYGGCFDSGQVSAICFSRVVSNAAIAAY